MNQDVQRFAAFWRKMPAGASPAYVHPDDAAFIRPERPEGLQLHLLPMPVNGNLEAADVVILMLNSGFGEDDVLWERAHPKEHLAMLASQRDNLQQEYVEDSYSFYDFNPLFRDHPGAAYWKGGANLAVPRRQRQKLAGVAGALAQAWREPKENVFRELSRRIAVLQLFPYRSTTFSHGNLLERLPNCIEALKLAKSLAAHGDKLLVVPRSVRAWGFAPAQCTNRLVTYEPGQARSASLSLNSTGGQALFQRLLPRHAARK